MGQVVRDSSWNVRVIRAEQNHKQLSLRPNTYTVSFSLVPIRSLGTLVSESQMEEKRKKGQVVAGFAARTVRHPIAALSEPNLTPFVR